MPGLVQCPLQLHTYVERVGFKEIALTTEFLVEELAPRRKAQTHSNPNTCKR